MKAKIILATSVLLITLSALAAPPSEEGKALFTSRCAACHNVHKIIVGPALAGVDQRRPIDWIIRFVHSSQTVVKSGDPYAVALFNKFKVQMPDHPDLTENNIKSIVEYIKTEAKTAVEKPIVKTEPLKTDYLAIVLSNKGLLVTALVLIALVITASAFFVQVKQMQRSKNL